MLAVACAGAGGWCGADVPCKTTSHGRDPGGILRLEIDEDLAASYREDRSLRVWLVYPDLQPVLAAVGSFRYGAATPRGAFSLCLVTSVGARQRRSSAANQEAIVGSLVLLSFEPSRGTAQRFPLGPALEAARSGGLLTTAQSDRLAELDRMAQRRADDVLAGWREFVQSPALAHSRSAILDRVRGFDDPQPVISRDELRPERFFGRLQREALRQRGHAIRGECHLGFSARSSRVALTSCPLSQLADEWNRRKEDVGVDLPWLLAAPGHEHEETDSLVLELRNIEPRAAAQRAFGLLSALPGLVASTTRP